MKLARSFAPTAATAAAAAALGAAASMTMLLASTSFVPVAAAEHAHLPRRNNKACNNMKNMIVKHCATTAKPRTKKPTAAAAAVKKPTKKPSKRPTRFPTTVPSAGPSSSPSDSPTASASPTTHPTAECFNVGVPVQVHDGHRYAYVELATSLTWDGAQAAAEALTCCGAPGHLVTVGDAAERDFVQAMMSGAGRLGWVGFNDAATEGTYVWTDGTTLDTSLFTPKSYNASPDVDDCGLFLNNMWNSFDCAATLGYSIIEFDCVGPEPAI
jgi:Lectin C-type domain